MSTLTLPPEGSGEHKRPHTEPASVSEPAAPVVSEPEGPAPVIGQRLFKTPKGRKAVVFIHSAEPLNEDQRAQMGEYVTELKPSSGKVCCGVLEDVAYVHQVVPKNPFIMHIESALYMKEPI